MGIQMYIYAAILAVGLAMGGTIAYKIEHAQVLSMELKIANQKVEAAQLLAVETQKVVDAEENQRKLNTEKDKNYAKLQEDSSVINNQLNNIIDGLRFEQRWSNSSIPQSQGNSTGINSTDDSQFTWISKKLLIYLAGESKRADQDGIDKNRLLDFVNQDNCGIPK